MIEKLTLWQALKDWCRFLRECGHKFGSPEMRRELEAFRDGWRQGSQ